MSTDSDTISVNGVKMKGEEVMAYDLSGRHAGRAIIYLGSIFFITEVKAKRNKVTVIGVNVENGIPTPMEWKLSYSDSVTMAPDLRIATFVADKGGTIADPVGTIDLLLPASYYGQHDKKTKWSVAEFKHCTMRLVRKV